MNATDTTPNEQTATTEQPSAAGKTITVDDLLEIPEFMKRTKKPGDAPAKARPTNPERKWNMPKNNNPKKRTAKSVRTDPAVLAEKRRKKVEAAEARAARKAAKLDKAAQKTKAAKVAKVAKPKTAKATGERKPRENSKQAQLIAMLSTAKGATADEIGSEMGWQRHTVRGAIAGALKKKLGLNVVTEKVEGRGNVYRIA